MPERHHLNFQPTAYTVRIYVVGDSYRAGDPYAGVFHVQMIGEDTAYLSGLHGTVTASIHRQIKSRLKMMGVTRIVYEDTRGKRWEHNPGEGHRVQSEL